MECLRLRQLKENISPEQRERVKARNRNEGMTPEQIERRKARLRQRRTGITPEMFNRLLVYQGGRCGCCGVLFDEKLKPFADHDHAIKVARGLLCRHCNTAEGFITKTGLTPIEFGKRLQQYLDGHSLV